MKLTWCGGTRSCCLLKHGRLLFQRVLRSIALGYACLHEANDRHLMLCIVSSSYSTRTSQYVSGSQQGIGKLFTPSHVEECAEDLQLTLEL